MRVAVILGMCAFLIVAPANAWSLSDGNRASGQDAQDKSSAPAPPAAQAAPPAQSTAAEATSKTASTPCPKSSAAGGSTPNGAEQSATAKTDCTEPPPTKTKKHSASQKKPGASGSGSTRIVRNGSTTNPAVQIFPSVSEQQASRQLEDTNQLLAKTDANLQKIPGQLNPAQQETVNQVKSYMEQAKTAMNGGDVQRAYNLARKANLLSTDLAGHP
jgi:hypothetical protein